MLEIGSLVDGKYRILSKCGQGGMSVVYMARNERVNRTWAIKEIRREGVENFDVVRRGLRMEMEMLKRLQHPQLPGMIDVIEKEDSILIVMDYIEGVTLGELVKRYGALPPDQVIEWARQLCSVLHYLHTRRPAIVYRDMKPSNVMLKPDGNVVLVDFGTAREYKEVNTEDTVCLGTRGYAAPEQYGGAGQTDVRTDIYGLGATLYHLLTGCGPGDPPYEMRPIRQKNPQLSAGLEAIVWKCTRNRPEERYQSCAELFYALEHYWEEDEAFRAAQIRKLRTFLLPAGLAVLFGVGALTFWGLKARLVKNSYEGFLEAAKRSVTKEEEIGYYRRAVNLRPQEGEAYLELLEEGLLDDRLLTREESKILRSVLIDYGDGKSTNEERLWRNQREYEQFAYAAGIAYYYRFEDKSSKKSARGYLEAAAEGRYLEEGKRERARRLYVIADYYSQVGIPDETGDAFVSFRDYWRDMEELTKGNLVETDNARTALIMYQELTAQVIGRAYRFREAGVKKEQLLSKLADVKKHLKEDFRPEAEDMREELKELQKEIERAERIVDSAYGK